MATKPKRPKNQLMRLPDYGELQGQMMSETASIVTDFIRQYVGYGSDGIYMNQDRVQAFQTYQGLAQYDLYAEVERDPHVMSALQTAKLNIAGMKYDINAYTPSKTEKPKERDLEIAFFVKTAIKRIGFFQQHLFNMMDALGMGFSVSELIWDPTPEGIFVKEILNRPQRRFQFDAFDRTPRVRTMTNPYFGDPLPDKKFIVHRVSSTQSNPFGDALDQSAYWMWLFKRMVTKFWMTHLEVGASSIPIVKHPADAEDQLKNEALAIAEQIRNGAYGRLPENFDLIWAEAKNAIQNAEAYALFHRMCNDEISKLYNGQVLTAEAGSGDGKGTQALGKVHAGVQSARDVFRAEGLASTLNATLIKWLVDFNFSEVEGYPEFRFDLEQGKDLMDESVIIKNLVAAGYEFDVDELSDKFNYTITKSAKPALDPLGNKIPPTDPNAPDPTEPNPKEKK